MKYKSFEHMNCSLAKTLDVVGERWTLLILRDAFFGVKRFNHFERSLGIAKNILCARLTRLVEEGIMEKRESAEGAHLEYVLTQAGWDLQPVLLALTHWGDRHKPDPRGARLIFVERATGKPIRSMAAVSDDGRSLAPDQLQAVSGPAFGDDCPLLP